MSRSGTEGRNGRELMEKGSLVYHDMEIPRGEEFDDDGRPRRTGTMYTASAHIVTAVIGSGVLSLAWAMAQLGWIAGTLILALFAGVTLFTSLLLTDCYRHPDPATGKRNHTYMGAVKANLGATHVWLCGICQYVNLCGTSVGYTITASISASALSKASCFHNNGRNADCTVNNSYYMVGFGVLQIFLSQLPDIHELWWLSIVAAVMSLSYAFIAIGLSIAKIVSGNAGKTSITGVEIGVDLDKAQKVFKSFMALGDIAFSYSYAMILVEIQDTLRSHPPENKVMKKASIIGVLTTSAFYISCGCLGYAAFGNDAPGNILTGFGFYEPFWLVDIGNICIIIHLIGAYQVFCQPVFAVVERRIAARFPEAKFLTHDRNIAVGERFKFRINLLRLIWRTSFVIVGTFLAILLPFFNDILGLLGAIGFWPLAVFFPVEMHISQQKITRGTQKWIMLKTLSTLCFLISLAAAIGSVHGVVNSLQHFTPFHTKT